MSRELRAPCYYDPGLFDREVDGEPWSEANERMKYASNLCKTVCHRLEECNAKYLEAPHRTVGVIAGRYRGFSKQSRVGARR